MDRILVAIAGGVAGLLFTFYIAHRRRRRGTERLIADLKTDEAKLQEERESR